MNFTDALLISNVPKRDPRAVARLISLIENGNEQGRNVLSTLYSKAGKAHIVGVTGSPGAGKSTLVDQLAVTWRQQGKSVAILAVDPSSPFTGGAILGDRIRMNRVQEDPDVFLRSMATRGALGGLARSTSDAIQVLDCAGFDIILVETVGVGQAEVDIMRSADTCIVVLVPGMGDGVQIIKAGLIEIADVFVINKADRDGAGLLERDILTLLSLVESPPEAWRPKVVSSVATEGKGREEIVKAANEHKVWLESSELGRVKKSQLIKHMILKLVGDLAVEKLVSEKTKLLNEVVEECLARKISPYNAVKKLGI